MPPQTTVTTAPKKNNIIFGIYIIFRPHSYLTSNGICDLMVFSVGSACTLNLSYNWDVSLLVPHTLFSLVQYTAVNAMPDRMAKLK